MRSPNSSWLSFSRAGHKDFKPKDPIKVRYYMTQLPNRAEDVGAFLEEVLRRVGQTESAAVEVEKIKQVLLATYGKEPEDFMVRVFAAEQLWYAPRKDFLIENLTPSQRAVLQKVDQRILELKAKP